MLARQGSLESAISQFEEALKLKSNLAEAHYNLGLLLLRKGQSDRASAEFQKARQLDPQLQPPRARDE